MMIAWLIFDANLVLPLLRIHRAIIDCLFDLKGHKLPLIILSVLIDCCSIKAKPVTTFPCEKPLQQQSEVELWTTDHACFTAIKFSCLPPLFILSLSILILNPNFISLKTPPFSHLQTHILPLKPYSIYIKTTSNHSKFYPMVRTVKSKFRLLDLNLMVKKRCAFLLLNHLEPLDCLEERPRSINVRSPIVTYTL